MMIFSKISSGTESVFEKLRFRGKPIRVFPSNEHGHARTATLSSINEQERLNIVLIHLTGSVRYESGTKKISLRHARE